jgi:hypothetical protein
VLTEPHGVQPNDALLADNIIVRAITAAGTTISFEDRLQCNVRSFHKPLVILTHDARIFGCLAPCGNTWVSTKPVFTFGPNYVMVQIVDPPGSAQCEQLSVRGTQSGFISKAVLVNSTWRTLDGEVPRTMRFFPGRKVTDLHVRFLNPDGSLYNLQGKPWSATLLFET